MDCKAVSCKTIKVNKEICDIIASHLTVWIRRQAASELRQARH
jgi:hypothetical protein